MEQNNTPQFAAIFLDFENIYYFLSKEFMDPPNLNDAILELLRNLRGHLSDQFGLDCIISNAYADFERLGSTPQGGLFLMGVDTKNVMGTEHKNAADMRLCIDALEVLYTRPEIQSFVLVTGDRDYIPLIQHLRRKARHILGAGFKVKASGDLLLNLGEGRFIDVTMFLSPATREAMASHRELLLQRQVEADKRIEKQALELEEKARRTRDIQDAPLEEGAVVIGLNGASAKGAAPDTNRPDADKPAERVITRKTVEEVPEWRFERPRVVVDEGARECLRLILLKLSALQKNGYANELWLGPFKRHLTDAMPELADWERREVIEELVRAGAIAVEKRDGEPYPFSVIIVNYRHPDVWDLNPAMV